MLRRRILFLDDLDESLSLNQTVFRGGLGPLGQRGCLFHISTYVNDLFSEFPSDAGWKILFPETILKVFVLLVRQQHPFQIHNSSHSDRDLEGVGSAPPVPTRRLAGGCLLPNGVRLAGIVNLALSYEDLRRIGHRGVQPIQLAAASNRLLATLPCRR